MLSAKLFASLAILQLGLSLLESKMPQAAIDFYPSWDIFVVFHVRHLPILFALISAFFGLVYFTAYCMRQPLNNSLAP